MPTRQRNLLAFFLLPLGLFGLHATTAKAASSSTSVFLLSGTFNPSAPCSISTGPTTVSLGTVVGTIMGTNLGLQGNPVSSAIHLTSCTAGSPLTIAATTPQALPFLIPADVFPLEITGGGSGASGYLGFQVAPTAVTGTNAAPDLNKPLRRDGTTEDLGTLTGTTGNITVSFQFYLWNAQAVPTGTRTYSSSVNVTVAFA